METEPKVLKIFALRLGTEINNWRLDIPEKFGAGYCTGFVFNEHIRMLIFNYELNDNLTIENPDFNTTARTILFKFQNIFPQSKTLLAGQPSKAPPSVLIATRSPGNDAVLPIHSNTATINIEVDAQYLNGQFDLSSKALVLQSLLQNSQPLVFEQLIYPALQKIVDEIVGESVEDTFKLFFLRVKAEELVCRLLIELEKRDAKQLYPVNNNDIEILYQIKAQMLQQLETPPLIKDLAIKAGMSPTKLKRLFKQIFGNSIFNYYQEFRMKEAAYLLKEQKQPVSAVGYQLGFINLGHFSKVFTAHIGMKPKKYSQT